MGLKRSQNLSFYRRIKQFSVVLCVFCKKKVNTSNSYSLTNFDQQGILVIGDKHLNVT
ncbi:hypothetical protein TK6N_09450 [Tetragenococcus koreensis]|nr:hypothetical protein TK6N_09450 [Tetragenococcus koreensis]